MTEKIFPLHNESDVMFANGQALASWCNQITRQPYENVDIAQELAGQAYEAHGLPYEPSRSEMDKYPPIRFTWFCDETVDAKQRVKVRDDNTGRVVTWPHWRG